MNPKIKTVVQNVSMGLGHAGISELLKRELKIDVSKLSLGEVVMCINKKGDKLKVIGARGMVLGYLKTTQGSRLMLEAIQYLPTTFGGGGFNYSEAAKMAILEKLKNKRKTPHGLEAFRKMRNS